MRQTTNQSGLIILGGTFDPVHNGHIKLAKFLSDKFALPVTLLPCGGVPPYKAKPTTTILQRLAMVQLIKINNPNIVIDTMEIEDSNYTPTYFTLKNLRARFGPDFPIFFVIGSDSLISFDTWDNWRELFSLSNFIVAKRNGYNEENMSQPLKQEVTHREVTKLKVPYPSHGKIYMLDFTPVDVASTLIRQLVKNNQQITDLVPPEIEKYIYQNKLYQA